MIQKFVIDIDNDKKISKHQIPEAVAKEIAPWNLKKKMEEYMKPVPFGWSRKQFFKWLFQEQYKKTKRRRIMDALYSIAVGSMAGWAGTHAFISGNYIYMVFAAPATIRIIRLRISISRGAKAFKNREEEFKKKYGMDRKTYVETQLDEKNDRSKN